ncbi:TPA: hypothetical protein HA242_07475 [Candidatus Woesearchaeota archaeon]|nr:hypothetical protein [Candidatus Woesearchaeota archaeon]HIH13536.1 hypothetical protein [Candidatus Woesearchaeota archaeon]
MEVEISSQSKKIRLSSLIDTSADYTIFSRSVADGLGIIFHRDYFELVDYE